MTDVGLEDSNNMPVHHKWCLNYDQLKVIVVSCLNLCPIAVNDEKKGIAKIAAKRARDDDDEFDVVEVLGIKKAAINK